MSNRAAIVLALIVSCVSLVACRARDSGTSLKDDQGGGVNQLPPETLHNLVLEFGFSQKLNSSGGAPWTKFILTLADQKIYIMNAQEQKFHYEFAVKNIPGFGGMMPGDFDQATLFNASRTAISGGIILLNGKLALDLVSHDVLPHDLAIKVLKQVRAAIFSDQNMQFGYMPAFNQIAAVNADRAVYEQQGIQLISPIDASPETAVYSEGWSFGRLVQVPSDRIDDEFNAGRLKPTDILLTDGVPAEIPVLAGVITSFPATPNSHVAILSKSFQIPFLFTRDAAQMDRLLSLRNKEIIIKASGNSLWGFFEVHAPPLTNADRKALTTLKTPTGLKYPEKKSYRAASGKIYKPAGDMVPADNVYFGGKATNFRVLTTAARDHAPVEAIGISFDLWDEFMATARSGGMPLKDLIKTELGAVTYPPADMLGLKAKLLKVRNAIKDAAMPDQVRSQLLDALQASGFASDRKIRFRSSTNVEDGESFSGAGLYDSYSGCLGDDLGSASTSACKDAGGDTKPKKVVSAVRKVFASFYNDNAFLERLRRGVKSETVGMAMAVHYSFPDDNELANGVIVTTEDDYSFQMQVVSQPGAESVTNPPAGSRPEEAALYASAGPNGDMDIGVVISAYAQKLPAGKLVLDTEERYTTLGKTIVAVQKEYRKFHGLTGTLSLDIEYKLVNEPAGARLILKQVRVVPAPKYDQEKYYVLGRRIPLCLVQSGSFGGGWETIMSPHYLKGAGSIQVRSGWLSSLVGRRDFLTSGKIEFLRGGKKSPVDLNRLTKLEAKLERDPLSTGSHLSVRAGGKRAVFGQDHELEIKGGFYLDARMPVILSGRPSNANGSPAFMLTVTSDNQISDFDGTARKLSVDYFACDENPPLSTSQTQTIDVGDARLDLEYVYSSSTFYKQELNLAGWKRVVVSGLTAEPFEIKDDSARTYSAGHHNFHEIFFFEPALDPGVPASTLAELRQKNIRAIFAEKAFDESGIRVIGFDNQVRKIGTSKAFINLPLPGGDGDAADGGTPVDLNGPLFDGGGNQPPMPRGLIGF
jgi:hypothetical protein